MSDVPPCPLESSTNPTRPLSGCSGYAQTYTQADDPRLEEMLDSLSWFQRWHDAVFSLPLSEQLSKTGRARMFISWETWHDMRLMVHGFVGMCRYWLPGGAAANIPGEAERLIPRFPAGMGIRCVRCSQDNCEAYFNYLRTCGGASSHPLIGECLTRAAGRTMATALSSTANGGFRGGRKRKVFDEKSVMLPLKSSRRRSQQVESIV